MFNRNEIKYSNELVCFLYVFYLKTLASGFTSYGSDFR